ncbi:MAG: hypothetical protein A2339_02650 [Elusimicrobia bacterium RIFOXYB12_FULL_50_12]|nr:MAG: hypothetical protein A2278_06740 [Elusimicrobia bacterium RIFOXYA12_FULL_49_49]OGS16259.1 MAG: hypothetical protein A2251_01445 [Elusimicrobia bacterium RIFOXYA2_FULL_47_53]OGS26198.1 MAG: hypothetical protein A2339_02650 [Elusimicrobia bacterium RIFOXYB12_FULL_50_12]OGS31414.1 MAG: hypothetical protein A2323_09735 [Elusimicrobia bacterium RIFOXYB2_FULL_46_23]
MRPGAIWRELVKNLLRKPVTVLYPAERMAIPYAVRGKPVFEPSTCIGCMMCVRDCPSEAVKIEKLAEKTFACTFYLDRCIYCGQCAESCPRKSITMTHDYELACIDKSVLKEYKKGAPQQPK